MTITPKVTTEDVRLALHGTLTGSTYYFWGQGIASGSVLAQINIANYYMYGILGQEKMDSSDEYVTFHIKTAQLDYACFRLITVLSGDVITDGFNFTAGISVQQPSLLSTYRLLMEQYKESYQVHINAIQDIAYGDDYPMIEYGDASPSFY